MMRHFCKTLCLAGLVLLYCTTTTQAQCAQWDVSGQWSMTQGKETRVFMQIEQDGSVVRGEAKYWDYGLKSFRSASLDGTTAGNNFRIQIYWKGTSVGVYEGNIGPQGRIEGTTYDRQKPSVRASWFSDKAMKCARR